MTEEAPNGPPASAPGTAVCALAVLTLPQVVAAAVVLAKHANDTSPCDAAHRFRWQLWAQGSAVRLSLHLLVIFLIYLASRTLGRESQIVRRLYHMRSMLDAIGMCWFLLGNAWILSGSGDETCRHPGRSPVYLLCFTMLVINYIQVCLPCVVAILIVPVICFCLPCILRWLRMNQPANASANKGASASVITSLPLKKYSDILDSQLEGEVDSTCPICISDFDLEEELRVLPCGHHFHSSCVDEWLRVNSTCPSCRRDIAKTSPDNSEPEEPALNVESSELDFDEDGDERALELAPLVHGAS
mmetsp:Transcript_25292/g.51964  ORF Transcript_25292/g.51964 Transcript_25292/m.51964 type:complete len:302 (+) Transcript_25292:73-978(+)